MSKANELLEVTLSRENSARQQWDAAELAWIGEKSSFFAATAHLVKWLSFAAQAAVYNHRFERAHQRETTPPTPSEI